MFFVIRTCLRHLDLDRHRHKSDFFLQIIPVFLHTYTPCSELPSNISTMGLLIQPNSIEFVYDWMVALNTSPPSSPTCLRISRLQSTQAETMIPSTGREYAVFGWRPEILETLNYVSRSFFSSWPLQPPPPPSGGNFHGLSWFWLVSGLSRMDKKIWIKYSTLPPQIFTWKK